MSEKQLPILMACHLSVRFDENQFRAGLNMPYHVDKWCKKKLLIDLFIECCKRFASKNHIYIY